MVDLKTAKENLAKAKKWQGSDSRRVIISILLAIVIAGVTWFLIDKTTIAMLYKIAVSAVMGCAILSTGIGILIGLRNDRQRVPKSIVVASQKK